MKHLMQSNKYFKLVLLISAIVAVLIYFPEWLSLFGEKQSVEDAAFPGMKVAEVILEVLFAFISLLILFMLNVFLFKFNDRNVRITWQKMLLSLLVTLIASRILGRSFMLLHEILNLPVIHSTIHFFLHPVRDVFISVIVSGSCYIIYLIRKSQAVQVENQQLRTESLLNQFEALKNQLNPHMLFNSLNTLRSLIRENPDRAQDYLQELSHVLRYTLQENEEQRISLRDEMEFVNAYIFLLKMRYEDNLEFIIEIEPDAASRQLPPISVQQLIENAVKHNEISNRFPLTITLKTSGDRLTVSNPVHPKMTPSRGTGIGLNNLAKRYRLLYKKEIDIKKEQGIFSVTIPLI